jgi:peptide/nickel transport system permease protein
MTVKAIPGSSLAPAPVRRRLTLFISASASMKLGIALVLVLAVIAIVARFWTPYNPTATGTGPVYAAPSLSHLFGTDSVGTDIFSQTLAAAGTDMSLTLAAVVVAFVVGTFIGAVAGFAGGWIDLVTMRLMEMLQAFPALLLAMLMVAAVGSGLVNVLFVVAVLGIPNYVRLVRAEILSKKNWQFAEAAQMVGNRPVRVLFRHLLPNSLTPPIAFSSVNASWVAVIIASLGFIGLGIEPGSAEWGSMISRGQDAIVTGQWWISVFPGLGILLLSGAFYLIGDGLSDATGTRRN